MGRKRKPDLTAILLLGIAMLILTVVAYYHWIKRISRSTLDIKLKITIYFFHFANVALVITTIFHKTPLVKDYGVINFIIEFSFSSLIAFIPSLALEWALEKFQFILRRTDTI
ncbi:hypothetical protein CH370_18700 [Leptospira kmetyi]|uniref:Uncharacterized protein n=3 Tax=Leptospira TaxID=171 RepID=A0A2N0B4B9_9LEPT|nr:hypothetical protein CH378_12505 [Leptospira kmetyi]PJZ39957.1 hypothetical protein CH370_18700 [Leptospira kmetyi]PJZ91407.1 hypothetical protein CH379_18845 [Leptospira ellisii]